MKEEIIKMIREINDIEILKLFYACVREFKKEVDTNREEY